MKQWCLALMNADGISDAKMKFRGDWIHLKRIYVHGKSLVSIPYCWRLPFVFVYCKPNHFLLSERAAEQQGNSELQSWLLMLFRPAVLPVLYLASPGLGQAVVPMPISTKHQSLHAPDQIASPTAQAFQNTSVLWLLKHVNLFVVCPQRSRKIKRLLTMWCLWQAAGLSCMLRLWYCILMKV